MDKIAISLLTMFFATAVFAFSCQHEKPIIQKPIIFNQKRVELTREYQREHYGINSSSIAIEPKMIVLHWTALPTFNDAFEFMNSPLLADRKDLPGKLNVSAHFLVDRDGTIVQLMPDNWMARHVIGLNHFAIGIENVGNEHSLTEAQAESDAFLVCYLKKKYPGIQYLIGHYEYQHFRGSPLWLEKNKKYSTSKADPGEKFLKRVKELSQS